jgi:hypothetical protein
MGSFNRQLLQQRQGPTGINRITHSVSGDYVMTPDDDVVIETGAGHIISLPLNPLLGDVHSVTSQGGANTLSGNGRTINGAASLGLLLLDEAQVTFDGANWLASIANSSGGGSGGGQFNVVLANGLNSNVNTQGQAVVRVGGPTAAYSIDGFAPPIPPTGGARFVLVNTTTFPLTIVDNGAGSAVGNKITTLRSSPVRLPSAGSSCAFVFDNTANKWTLEHIGTRNPVEFNVKDFGAVGDGVTDDTAAIQAAINAASAAGVLQGYVVFPPGQYLCTATLTCSSAITLTGSGKPQAGGGTGLGTLSATLMHNFDGDFIVFDGANGTAKAQGGGIVHLRLLQVFGAAGGANRGNAILFTAADDNHRPGYCRLHDLVVDEANGAGPWTRGTKYDGSNCPITPGLSNMIASELTFHTSNVADNIAFEVFCAGVNLFASSFYITGGVKVWGTAPIPAQLRSADTDMGPLVFGDYSQDSTVIGGIVSTITTTVHTLGRTNVVPARLAGLLGGITDNSSSCLGVWFYDDDVIGHAPGSFRSNKPYLLPNSSTAPTGSGYFQAINAAGTDTIFIAFVDGSDIVRLGQNAVVGVGNNPASIGANPGDLCITRTNYLSWAKSIGHAARFLGIDASNRMLIGIDDAGLELSATIGPTAVSGATPAVLGTMSGGAGEPTTGAQNSWAKFFDSAGNPFYVPCWR